MVQDGNEDDDDAEDDDLDDGASFASVDDLDGAWCVRFFYCSNWFHWLEEGQNHLLELSKLAEKDPEFYKYLQENDKELLDFNPDSLDAAESSDEEDGDGDVLMDEEERIPILTKDMLRQWQKPLLQVFRDIERFVNLSHISTF